METNTFKRQKEELEEIRKESFKQGIWEGKKQSNNNLIDDVLKVVDEMINKGQCPDCSEIINKCKCDYKKLFVTINRDELKQKLNKIRVE